MNICVFGDSITYGAYDPINGGWVNLLRNYFEKKFEGEVATYNLGISGDTTEGLLKRMENELIPREPEIIVVSIGINDAQYIYSQNDYLVTFDQFQKNVKNIWEIAKKFTSKIIFVGLTTVDERKTTPISWDADKAYKNERIEIFNQFIQDFCHKNHLPFIEVNKVLGEQDLDDGLHPNTTGHQKIFEKVRPVVWVRDIKTLY